MSVVSFCLFSGATLVAHAEADNFIEPGRYGAEWAVTEDTVFIGPTYRGEKLEAAFFLSGHKMTDGAPVESWVVNARLGYRHNLGLHNYLSGGLLANYIRRGVDIQQHEKRAKCPSCRRCRGRTCWALSGHSTSDPRFRRLL